MITSLKTYLKVCFPLLYGHLIASFILLRENFKKYKYDSYSEAEIDLSPQEPVNDVATSLFLRVICEANYENVVEVGSKLAFEIFTRYGNKCPLIDVFHEWTGKRPEIIEEKLLEAIII